MRYLCIDLGDKRTGIALGDAITRLASPVEVIEADIRVREGGVLLDAIARVVARELGPPGAARAAALVFGLPVNMDGTEGPRAVLTRAFAARVGERTGFKVVFHDERLTSADAEWSLAGSGLTRKQKKERRDAVAAAAILRDFLASPAPGEPPPPRRDDEH